MYWYKCTRHFYNVHNYIIYFFDLTYSIYFSILFHATDFSSTRSVQPRTPRFTLRIWQHRSRYRDGGVSLNFSKRALKPGLEMAYWSRKWHEATHAWGVTVKSTSCSTLYIFKYREDVEADAEEIDLFKQFANLSPARRHVCRKLNKTPAAFHFGHARKCLSLKKLVHFIGFWWKLLQIYNKHIIFQKARCKQANINSSFPALVLVIWSQ